MHRYTPLPAAFFARNRSAFVDKMRPNTLAVFHANDWIGVNADGLYKFSQNSNFYYLSGIDQEDAILVLFPDAPNESWREILFVRETNEHIQIWEGWKYSKEEARKASDVKNVMFYKEFDAFLRKVVSHIDGVYVDVNEHERNAVSTSTGSGHRLAHEFRREFPAHQLYRAAPILEELRSIKAAEEIQALRRACDITGKAYHRVLQFLRPGVYEYEIEAEILHEFLRNGAQGQAYESIIASGLNACTLHYTFNSAVCKAGDLVLMDFGCEYANYSADLTRTAPVSGSFSPRQKAVYNACLRVFKAAMAMLVPGTLLESYHSVVGDVVQEELLGLGLITRKEIAEQHPEKPVYRKYFMHGTSHFLGLDTHDVGNRYKPMQTGMVFTCEPGIYIPAEKLGVRIETDVWISPKGPVDLMESLPLEVEEIEAAMKK